MSIFAAAAAFSMAGGRLKKKPAGRGHWLAAPRRPFATLGPPDLPSPPY